MSTPSVDDFDTIIKEFNAALSKMGSGMGDPVTRSEKALLKTFFIFLVNRGSKSGQDKTSHPLDDC